MNKGLYRCPGMPATCMAAARAMRLALPSTKASKVSAVLSLFLSGSDDGVLEVSVLVTLSEMEDGFCANWLLVTVSRGASANSMRIGCPVIFSINPARRALYCALSQSILKRLATKIVTLERSSATWADNGLIDR